MSATPKASWPWVKTLLHSVYDQPDAASVHAQYDRLIDAISEKLPKVAAHLDAARADVLAWRRPGRVTVAVVSRMICIIEDGASPAHASDPEFG
jgi:hypothetical protein